MKLNYSKTLFLLDLIFEWKPLVKWIHGPINSLWPSDAINLVLEIWVNIGSGNGLLPDDTKPLPEPMLTYQ